MIGSSRRHVSPILAFVFLLLLCRFIVVSERKHRMHDAYILADSSSAINDSASYPGLLVSNVSKIHQVTMILDNDSPEHDAYETALKIHLAHGERWGYKTHVLRQNIIGTPDTNGRDEKGEWKSGVFKKPLYLLSFLINELAKPEKERAEWIM